MSKKPYSQPTLTVHGSVEQLTLATGGPGANDQIFNSFTGRTFTGAEGGSSLCTINQEGNVGRFGCPEGFKVGG